jgi:hypothetical protein
MADVLSGYRQGTRARMLDPDHAEQTFFAFCALTLGLPTTALILAVVLDLAAKIPL